ncbi:MAG TPA: cytosine permease [Candidatus Obscuribacter sp.]|nr:cytosine permease [Candidatus Obscuribacter sp.]
MAGGSEHQFGVVPLAERRGSLTMGLLWITMVTAFPGVLIGFDWCKQGFDVKQVLTCTLLSCLLLLCYSIPAGMLGACTGQNYTMLSRSVFGSLGARLVAFNLIWVFVSFYGLAALFLAEGLVGLFHLNVPLMWLAAVLAGLMACNNFFGFKGVANFARFVAAPVLIAWVFYSFTKAIGICPQTILAETSPKGFGTALTSISGFIIGFAVWGNECDYWRFGKPKTLTCAVPLVVALVIGQIIFPLTGFMLAKGTGITEYGAATAFMNQFSFGGFALAGALVLIASYFAVNDSNLFGSVQACAQLKNWSPRRWVAILAGVGTVVAAWLSVSGAARALESITSLNCVLLPTATVIMMVEWFLCRRLFKHEVFAPLDRAPRNLRWPAIVALVAGASVGILTAGIIPGLESFHVGICSLQAWLTGIVIYVPLRLLEERLKSTMSVSASAPVPVPVTNAVSAHASSVERSPELSVRGR